MHYLPDTEDEDSAAEAFWPEGYKQVLREDVPQLINAQLNSKPQFKRVYSKGYSEKYSSHGQFLNRLADMVAIGAENGADDAFDSVVDALLAEDALPQIRRYARYTWPQPFSHGSGERLRQIIVDEYRQDDVYSFSYKVGYKNDFPTFDEYLNGVAQRVITGAMNGANDILEAIYRAFMHLAPLPPARRHPRRLKNW